MAADQGLAMTGTLYGVGVGPGDPELMTVKAWRLVSTARCIAYLAANGGESTARSIAAPFIPPDVEEVAIDMPMRVELEPARAAYDSGCEKLRAVLEGGRDVVMLCEGDPFFYGSFMHVFERMASRHPVVVVPGVTSLTASACAMGLPLAARDEVVKVLPATMEPERLREELATAPTAAIIKVGRHFGKIRRILDALDLSRQATVIERATQHGERIRPLNEIDGDTLPYFTTILVKAEPLP
jgi:precorrin-2/cobalt-factor-2 C20-methyltransferase